MLAVHASGPPPLVPVVALPEVVVQLVHVDDDLVPSASVPVHTVTVPTSTPCSSRWIVLKMCGLDVMLATVSPNGAPSVRTKPRAAPSRLLASVEPSES